MSATHKGPTIVGGRLTQRQIKRGLLVNMLAGALGMMWCGAALGVPVTMFMERLHASGVAIGMVATLQQAFMAMQIPGAIWAQRLALRKPYWAVTSLVHRAVWFVPAALPFMVPPGQTAVRLMLAVVAVSALMTHMSAASWYSWMADLIPDHLRNRFWARRQSVVMAAYLLSVAGSGWLLDRFSGPQSGGDGALTGFSLVFGLAAILGCADIVTHLWVPEPRPFVVPERQSLFKRILEPLREADFRWLTLTFGAWNFSVGLVGSFGIIYLKREFDVSYMHLSLTTVSAGLGIVVAGLLWGRVMDHIGCRTFCALLLMVCPLFGTVWFFMLDRTVVLSLPLVGSLSLPQPILLLLLVNAVSGAFYSGIALSQLALTGVVTRHEGRTVAMAVHWTAVGLMGAVGPLIGGRLMDVFTANPPNLQLPTGTVMEFQHILVLLHAGTTWFLVLPLLVRVREGSGDLPVRALVGNPLRAVSIIQSVMQLGEAVTWRDRARAVRRLGDQRAPYAVTDLIAKLDDPSAEVREEAARALGRIGSPAAVDALVAKLDDPDSDLSAQVARALRDARSPRSVDALLRQLGTGDRETQTESARALGAIGDRRAVPSLLELLEGTDDVKILSASGEALARLGEVAAIFEMLPRMKATRNPVLRRSLALALGDLLGNRDSFYTLLVQEEQHRGIEVARRCDDLRARIRASTGERMKTQAQALAAKCLHLEEAYDDGDLGQSADILFDLAIGLAALTYGLEFGGDAEAFIHVLLWRDERFGVGLWFLDQLRGDPRLGAPHEPDMLDVLLGVHVVTSWAPKQDGKANPSHETDAS